MRHAPEHRPLPRRHLVALLASAAVALPGCAPASTPTLQLAEKLLSVAGVASMDGKQTAGASGRNWYQFSGTLNDSPSADTLGQLVATYREALPALKAFNSEFRVTWKQGAAAKGLTIISDDRFLVPTDAQARAIATWPELPLVATYNQGILQAGMRTNQEAFRRDLDTIAHAGIAADTFAIGSEPSRYSVSWDDQAPLATYDAVVAAAPDAATISIGSTAPSSGSATQGWIEVAWATGDDAQLKAVTDVWATSGKPVVLTLKVGGVQQVSLTNSECPTTRAPRNAEFWAYATSDGRRIALAPSTC